MGLTGEKLEVIVTVAFRSAFQRKPARQPAGIVRSYGFEGVTFQPPPDSAHDWLRHAYPGAEHAAAVSFLAQVEEENFARLLDDGRLRLSWDALYELAASEDHREALPLIGMPPIRLWRPRLESQGGLADKDFAILLAGWDAPDGEEIHGDLRLDGAMVTWRGEESLLSKEAWLTVEAVAIFHRRWMSDRTGEGNRRGWATIRKHAVATGANLSDFLRSTVVLTPDKLKLRLRKGDAGTRLVEVIPEFAGAPEQWIRTFDRGEQVLDRYDIPQGEGMVQVMLSPEVQSILREIKTFPGRRVAGTRAEAFVRNPFAVLGPDAGAVLDPAEFEAERERAALGFARFTPEMLRNPQGLLTGVALHIDESLTGTAPRARLELTTVAELERFVAELSGRIRLEAQCVVWNGHELEILGETREHLASLEKALAEWRQQQSFRLAEILDLSQYSDRIEGFGVEPPRYAAFIARKAGTSDWFPEHVSYGVSWQPADQGPLVAMNIGEAGLEDWEHKLEAARKENDASIALPGMPSPIPLADAERILRTLDTVRRDVAQGQVAVECLKPLRQECIRKRLVLRSNVETVDYVERRGVLALEIAKQAQLPATLKPAVALKEHQREGLQWLQHLYAHSPADCRGALLADDMGLGKTLQVLAFIAHCLEADRNADPFLIVAPVALLENWKEEIDKFFLPGALPVLPLYGAALASRRSPRQSAETQIAEGDVGKLLVRDWLGEARIVLTTYETLRDLEFSLARQKWSVIVCDEAQKIKTPNALVTRAAKKQNARFKIACTGTPVENSLVDLWCLFDFIQPGLLGSLSSFGATYSRPIETKSEDEGLRLNELRALIEPQKLRRTKADVVRDLPARITVASCRRLPLSAQQRSLYAEAVRRYREPETAGRQKGAGDALSLLMYLRALCTHPMPGKGQPAESLSLKEMEKQSPKMAWLLAELLKIRMRQEKAIIFCEMRELQRALQRAVSERLRVLPDIINGQTSTAAGQAGNRHQRVIEFQQKPGFAVIILSPLAAGFGLNIQAANHVVHFTRSWNPAKEDQATDRAHRMGQTRDVFVYYPLVTAPDFETFDARLDQLLEQKRALSRDMLHGIGDVSPQDFGGF